MLEPPQTLTVWRPSATAVAIGTVGVALACWIVTAQRMRGMDMGPGTDLGSLTFFLGVWVTMMAAMMLPSALPMVLLFNRVSTGQRAAGRPAASTAIFVLTYLAVWSAIGLWFFLLYKLVAAADPAFLAWNRAGPWAAGAAVGAAGVYELTPLKRVCLRHCRSPMHFILGGWKSGTRGAIAMGAEHAAFCVGCCWGLMLTLFVLGVMSVTWMVAVAALVFAQKVLPFGDRLRWPLAVLLVACGAWIAVDPASVPGIVQPS